MRERRREPRRRTYLGGRVAADHKLTHRECVVRSLSAGGAKLAFEDVVFVPPEFDLEIAQLRATLRARIAWQERREVGVSFLDRSPSSNVVPLDAALRIRRLEADKRELADRIAQIGRGE